MTSPRASRPKTPGLLYSGLALVLVLIVGIVSLTQTQPPPPTIAEFAPQAVEQIEDAPVEQTSEFGSGEGGDLGDRSGAAPTPPPADAGEPPPIDVPRIRRCIGDPPRQIEDPQSPPCVPYWEGDNGGATYKGVTGSEIRVAMPDYAEGRDRALEAFFNSRFEFYGRKMRLVQCCKEGADPEDQQAAATAADEEEHVFASADYPEEGFVYYQELARRKLVAVSNQPNFTSSILDRHRPYIWQYPMEVDRMFANLGEWACNRIVGRDAEFAGRSDVTDMSQSERRFGIVLWTYQPEADISWEPLEQELERCGATADPKLRYNFRDEGVFNQETATNAALQMKQAGVTTVLCLCQPIAMGQMQRAATGQSYEPEWVILTYLLSDYNFMIQSFVDAPNQRERIFGLSFIPKQVPLSDNPSWWGVREGDPDQGGSGNATSVGGTPLNINYRALLLLASGIQMAGPNLTPESFAAGLQRATFPNPDHPIMAGDVGFGGGSHAMTTDAAEIWWSDDHRGPYSEGSGTYCYVDGGVRHQKGAWPTGPGSFFDGNCG